MSNKLITPAEPEVIPPETQVVEKALRKRADGQNTAINNSRTRGLMPPWEKGKSPNPGGRPKRKYLTDLYEEMLKRKLDDPQERDAYLEVLWKLMKSERVVGAMTRDMVQTRTEGKLTQPIDVSGEIDITSIIESGRKRLKE